MFVHVIEAVVKTGADVVSVTSDENGFPLMNQFGKRLPP